MSFHLFLGRPHNGWLPVDVRVDDYATQIVASNVLNDPVAELIDVAIAVAGEGAVNATVRLWLEPRWAALRFACAPASSIVAVEIHDVDRRTTLASTEVDRKGLAVDIVAALALFESRFSSNGTVAGWKEFGAERFRAVCPERRIRVFLRPWIEARGLTQVENEIRAELGRDHALAGSDFDVVARRVDSDDYLIELRGAGQLVALHVTWSGAVEDVQLARFASSDDWVERGMKADAAAVS
jgi:hypothetical protein